MAEAAKSDSLSPLSKPIPGVFMDHHSGLLTAATQEWSSNGRLPPVLLLSGKSGVGKRTLAYWLAQWIFCLESGFSRKNEEDSGSMSLFGEASGTDPKPQGKSEPCGKCIQCERARKGSWVDFVEIQPDRESSDTGGSLKIDQFRELKSSMGFGAHESAYRIILISSADRMTTQAANSVLKLLEEPPKGWIFFLTADDPTLLLPTVLSRCQVLRLKPFTETQIRELLAIGGVKADRIAICSELAQGSWGRALALSEDESWDRRKVIFEFLRNPGAVLNDLVDWASQAPEHFDLLLDQLEQISSELVLWSISPKFSEPEDYPWINRDGKAAFVSHARETVKRLGSAATARDQWISRAERIARARLESRAPLNRKLLTQDILMPWLAT